LQLRINATNVKIVVFIELNDKDAYCAHENARNARNVENINAFMNMHQLKVTQIWDMRLNEYLRYWSLKALKSVSVTLYKLQMKVSLWIQDKNWKLEEKLQVTKEFIFIDSISIYSDKFHAQKILDSFLFTDEKYLIWKN